MRCILPTLSLLLVQCSKSFHFLDKSLSNNRTIQSRGQEIFSFESKNFTYINYENFRREKDSAKKLSVKFFDIWVKYFGLIVDSKNQFFIHYRK